MFGFLFRQAVINAFDIEIHAQDLPIRQSPLAIAGHFFSVLCINGAFEGIQFAGFDGLFGIDGQFFDILRHIGEGRHIDHIGRETAPCIDRRPFAIKLGFDACDVIIVPVIDNRGQRCFGGKTDHVRGLTKRQFASGFGLLQGSRTIGVLGDDISALSKQGLGRIGFFAGVKPCIGPNDFHFDGRIDTLRAEHKGVDP